MSRNGQPPHVRIGIIGAGRRIVKQRHLARIQTPVRRGNRGDFQIPTYESAEKFCQEKCSDRRSHR